MRVQERCRRLENNVNDWIAQLEEKLEFAETAVEKFRIGDAKLQKSICTYLGRNWVLQAKKLTFTRHEWFTDLEELRNHFEQEKGQLELIKSIIEYGQTPSSKVVHTIGCRLREHIRTQKP